MPKSCTTKELSVEEMSALYDRIYNIADRLIKKHNPCNIHTTKTGYTLCKQYNTVRSVKGKEEKRHYLCCTACEYQSKTGCPIKCLPCKLFLCGSIPNGRVIIDRLYRLKVIAERKYKIALFPYYRTKNEILKDSLRKISYGR